MVEYTLEDDSSQICITHRKNHHLNESRTCSHHWILECYLILQVTLSQHHYRYAPWCCDVSEDLGRGICGYRPSANKLFLIIPNSLCWHTWVCICSNCVICHYYSCVNLGNHLYNTACWPWLTGVDMFIWYVIFNMQRNSLKWWPSLSKSHSLTSHNWC